MTKHIRSRYGTSEGYYYWLFDHLDKPSMRYLTELATRDHNVTVISVTGRLGTWTILSYNLHSEAVQIGSLAAGWSKLASKEVEDMKEIMCSE